MAKPFVPRTGRPDPLPALGTARRVEFGGRVLEQDHRARVPVPPEDVHFSIVSDVEPCGAS